MSSKPSIEAAILPSLATVSSENGEGKGKQEEQSEEGGAPTIPKTDRKKLKKLRKRSSRIACDQERSGLLTGEEVVEYQLLEPNQQSIEKLGPSIHLRKRKNGPPPTKVEGVKHRDLLAVLLTQIMTNSNQRSSVNRGNDNKRKRDDDDDNEKDPVRNAAIPSWASIHNPATLSNICILEIQIPSSSTEADDTNYLKLYEESIEESLKISNAQYFSLPTKWFQGYVPRSISDSLLYFLPNNNSNKRRKDDEDSTKLPSMLELIKKIQNLTIPCHGKVWEKEGYPKACQTTTETISVIPVKDESASPNLSSANKEMQFPNTVPLEKAKSIVANIGFRVECQGEDDDLLYVETQKPFSSGGEDDPPPRVFAMDCEMVVTSLGLELARITIVELNGIEEVSFEDMHSKNTPPIKVKTTTVFDELVKPENTIKDYVTKHSGISAKMMESVSTRLPQIQMALLEFLKPHDILIGHSLENDLRAARFVHPNVVDTALLFRPARSNGTKFSLRHLSAALLRKQIQAGSSGHCSEEDAVAALDLAVRRAWLGDTFALKCESEQRQSLLSGLTTGGPSSNTATSLTSVCIGPSDWIRYHITNTANCIHALAYDDIDECKKATLAWLKGKARKSNFMWTKVATTVKGKKGNENNDGKSIEDDKIKNLVVCL